MAITTLNLRGINRSDTATSGQVITATSAVAADFQDAAGGAWNKIVTRTLAGNATESFIDGTSSVVLDSTYKIYVFQFTNIHPSADGAILEFQVSVDGGSSWGVTLTSTYFRTWQNEGGSTTALQYVTAGDVANATTFTRISQEMGTDTNQTWCGDLWLYHPSDAATYETQWLARGQCGHEGNYAMMNYCGGYFASGTAIDGVQFKPVSGNLDLGFITLYGITT